MDLRLIALTSGEPKPILQPDGRDVRQCLYLVVVAEVGVHACAATLLPVHEEVPVSDRVAAVQLDTAVCLGAIRIEGATLAGVTATWRRVDETF